MIYSSYQILILGKLSKLSSCMQSCIEKAFYDIQLSKDSFKLKAEVCKKVSMLGVSSFITQMSIVVVMAFENNLLGKYGATSKFGSEIPITVLGIVMKINQILNSIIIRDCFANLKA